MSTPGAAARPASRGKTLALGGALGLVAVGGGAYLLLGGTDTAGPVVASRPATPHAVASTPAPPAPTPVVVPVAGAGRNPYKALYTPPTVAAVPVAAAAAATPAASATATATATAAATTYALKLVSVTGTGSLTASWTVDGTAVKTRVGEKFGKTGELKLLRLSRSTGAVFTVGSAAPVTLAIGISAKVS